MNETAALSASSETARARLLLLLSVVVTALLYVVPYGHTVAYPLILLSTLVHELAHGITAILVGGSFESFRMFKDGSGVAQWSGNVGRIDQALVAAGGLVGPAVGAALCFICARRKGTARLCLGGIGVALVLAEILVVRNLFGLVFVGIVAAICLGIAWRGGAQLIQLTLAFFAVQLALSVYSRGDYLFTRWAETSAGKMPSDVEQMAVALGVGPYWFWGGVCAAFSIVVLIAGSWYFIRGSRSR